MPKLSFEAWVLDLEARAAEHTPNIQALFDACEDEADRLNNPLSGPRTYGLRTGSLKHPKNRET